MQMIESLEMSSVSVQIHLICMLNIDILCSWDSELHCSYMHTNNEPYIMYTNRSKTRECISLKLSPRLDNRALGTITSCIPRIATVYKQP